MVWIDYPSERKDQKSPKLFILVIRTKIEATEAFNRVSASIVLVYADDIIMSTEE